jgi:hypothetical protein
MSGTDPELRAAEHDRSSAPAEESAPATPAPSAAPQPLASLSSLLGGSFESGQACDADGNCD